MDVFRNEQVCYKIFYLLSEKYVDMFAFGMMNKFTYQYMCSMTTYNITGFKTIEGRRHGEWLIGCYSTSYYEGEMISWRKYVVPVPRWCAPTILGLDRSWRLGEIFDHHAPYSTITTYTAGGGARYVDLMSPTNRDEVLKRYDWCERCQRALPAELAGTSRQPNLKTIEKFLALSARPDECEADCVSHMKN